MQNGLQLSHRVHERCLAYDDANPGTSFSSYLIGTSANSRRRCAASACNSITIYIVNTSQSVRWTTRIGAAVERMNRYLILTESCCGGNSWRRYVYRKSKTGDTSTILFFVIFTKYWPIFLKIYFTRTFSRKFQIKRSLKIPSNLKIKIGVHIPHATCKWSASFQL